MKFIRFRKFITHYSHEAPETYKNHKVATQVHISNNNCSCEYPFTDIPVKSLNKTKVLSKLLISHIIDCCYY